MKAIIFFTCSLYFFFSSLHETRHVPDKSNPVKALYKMRKQIPVLCYHNITKKEGKEDALWISEYHLDQQLRYLHDSGYHTILPDQLYQYLTNGSVLPEKPVLISFDDSHEEHFTIAAPVVNKYGYKAVFFIMTVCIGKKHFISEKEIKILADNGHMIGCHTWDHPNITTLKGKEWEQQIDKPKLLLEKITGKPVDYFAYPFGVFNDTAIAELKKRGVKAAFQLTTRRKENEPLFSIRRLMVSGKWSGPELIRQMRINFEK